MGFRGFRVQGLGGLGFRGLGFRVYFFGFRGFSIWSPSGSFQGSHSDSYFVYLRI